MKREGDKEREEGKEGEREGEGRRGEGFRKVTTMYSSLHHVFVCHYS